jgi:hypothetical protein
MTETTTTTAGSPAAPADFDPLYGRWEVRNRKLRDVLDPGCQEWAKFSATIECYPGLGGLGNIDHGTFDLDQPFQGLTLRLYEPGTGLWRIWWTSTRQPGQLDAPVVGRFDGGVGTFTAVEELAGRMTMVRFRWTGFAAGKPRWEQSFSYDEGASWKVNWTNDWVRLS